MQSGQPRENTEPQNDSDSSDNQQLLFQQEHQEIFSGPLPPPQVLDGYEKILAGSADRIMKMAESQIYHRHEMERKRLEADIKDGRIGMVCAVAISFFVISCGTAIIILHPSVWSYVLGSLLNLAGVSSIINAFLRKDSPTTKDRKK